MNDLGFFVGFLVIVIFLAIATKDGGTLFNDQNGETQNTELGWFSGEPTYESNGPDNTHTTPELTPEEIEAEVARIYEELNELKGELRSARLREPASPYQGRFTLTLGDVDTKNEDEEYLVLEASSALTSSVSISGWTIESYVTKEREVIPRGDRTLTRRSTPLREAIMLRPGDTAYLISGSSPVNTSFQEHMCSAYLASDEMIRPDIDADCPSPLTELRSYSRVALDDDKCYEFVENLSSCEVPSERDVDRARLSSSCERFIEDRLSYRGCIATHQNEPGYSTTYGPWRIYFEESSDLWRSEREIIRLKDGNGHIVDVIEY